MYEFTHVFGGNDADVILGPLDDGHAIGVVSPEQHLGLGVSVHSTLQRHRVSVRRHRDAASRDMRLACHRQQNRYIYRR